MKLTDKKRYQLLFEISQKVRDTLDLDEIMDHLLDTLKSVVDYDAAGIFVLNQNIVYDRYEQPKEMIAGIARRGFDTKPSELDAMLSFGEGIVGHVIFSGSSLVVPDVILDPRYVEGRSRTRSEIAVPIVRNNRAIGALNLESDHIAAYDETDLEILQFFADGAAISIEKAMLHRQLLQKELLDKQLELARDLQSRLFPSAPPHIDGYDIAGVCLPATEIGGDYYDFIPQPGNRLGVTVADCSGHGIPAALVMTAFRGLLRMHTHGRLAPAKIAHLLNHQLPKFTTASHFVTAVYAVLNPDSDELTYVSCGHPPPLLMHSDGSTESLGTHGPALGVISKVTYPTEKLPLLPGDTLLLYTDGVVELSDQAGIEFGTDRLKAALRQYQGLPAAGLIQEIIRTTRRFSGSQSYPDDFTLVVIKQV